MQKTDSEARGEVKEVALLWSCMVGHRYSVE